MTILSKMAYSIQSSLLNFKESVCDDGKFCERFLEGLFGATVVWIMYVALLPIM